MRDFKNMKFIRGLEPPQAFTPFSHDSISSLRIMRGTNRLVESKAVASTKKVRRPNSDGFETASMGSAAHRETTAKCEPPHTWDTNEGIKGNERAVSITGSG